MPGDMGRTGNTSIGTEGGDDGKCIDVLTDNLRDLESSYTDSTALSSLIYLFPNWWMVGLSDPIPCCCDLCGRWNKLKEIPTTCSGPYSNDVSN